MCHVNVVTVEDAIVGTSMVTTLKGVDGGQSIHDSCSTTENALAL